MKSYGMRIVFLVCLIASQSLLAHASYRDRSNQVETFETPATVSQDYIPLNGMLRQFDTYVTKTMHQKRIPGCAIAIVHNNRVIFMKGYGVRKAGTVEKINADTVFQLGSVSKPVAATVASVLEHQGVLRLDDPVSQYLPHFSLKGLRDRYRLKVKHVLNHSSGVSRAGFNDLIESHEPYNRLLWMVQKTPVTKRVGKQYDYHNVMYSLIGDIASAATQRPFQEVLHTTLLQPLKMTRTTASYEGIMRTPNRAYPHTRHRNGRYYPCATYSRGYYSVVAAGGLNSTARDMSIFLQAQLGGYPQVVSPFALAKMHQPQVATPDMLASHSLGYRERLRNASYGLGWRILDFGSEKLVFHGGWLKGFTNFIGLIPQHQVGIVVLHNSEAKFSSTVGMKFFDMFLKQQEGRVPEMLAKKSYKKPKQLGHLDTTRKSRKVRRKI